MVTNEMPFTTIPNVFATAVAATTADISDYPTYTMILVAYQAAVHISVAMVDPLVTIEPDIIHIDTVWHSYC